MRNGLITCTVWSALCVLSIEMTSVTLHGVTDTLPPDMEKYADALTTAAEAFKECEKLFADTAWQEKKGWRKDQEGDDMVVYAKNTPKGKMVTISTVLPAPLEIVMQETWTGVSGLPEWNPNINFAKTIATLTDHADLITYGNNDVLIVSGREFVSSRIYRKIPEGYMMASRSVNTPDFPVAKGKVRAWLHLAGARFRPSPSNPTQTLCDVVMLAELRGMLPQFVVNQVLGKIMLMDSENNVEHFQDIMEKKKKEEESDA